jgi:hypothetical protein
MGFALTAADAQRLIKQDTRNRDVLFPFLNGDDMNSRPDQSASRWVINFFDWSLEKASEYPACLRIVEQKVKPERAKLIGRNSIGTKRGTYWWHYGADAKHLYRTIAGTERVFVGVLHTKFWSLADYSPSMVFSHALVVFAFSDFGAFALLESVLHEAWAREFSGSLETRLRYTPSDCFNTFPFPVSVIGLNAAGQAYHAQRRQIMQSRQEGLTDTCNRFHDADETADDIQKLRDLHVEMDKAVAAAYDWDTLDLGHGFHETKQGIRFTISEAARRDVLQRLLKLNHERFAEEVKQGLHDKKKGAAKRAKAEKAPAKPKAFKNLSLGFDTEGDDE